MSQSGNGFSLPSELQITKITIDGQDVIGLFQSLSLYEDIYSPVITGNIVLTDSDGAKFIEENRIEFIEEIEIHATGSNKEELQFKGKCNMLRNEYVKGPIKYYAVDFSSEAVRENEQTFVVKSYKNTNPEEIIREMIEKIGGELETDARGQQMSYLGSRKRPLDIVKYVLTHALTQETQATEQADDEFEEEAKGTTGFLCWETVDTHKLYSVKDVLAGKAGEKHTDFKTTLAQRDASMEETTKDIVQVAFRQIGDFQTKLRSGAFGGKLISFDMDKGIYKEYKYYNEENMTEKQKEAFPKENISRFYSKMLDNQKFQNECVAAQPNTGDQSRKYLLQNSGQQNTFSDQSGEITLYCQFQMHAGDTIDIKVSKVQDEKSEGGYDEKHSGRYVIQSIGHNLFSNGKGYTKIKTIRSTIQQDDSSSRKS